MSDINYLKLYQPNLNVAFAGTDKDEVLADKFQGDSNEFFRAQNRRRVELLSKHTQVVDRPKTLVELEQSGIDLENKERREQERDYGFSLLKYHEAVGEIYGEGESIEDLINRVFEESSSKDTLATVTQAPVQTVSNSTVPKKTILDFDNAKQILAPKMGKLQGNVAVSDFEDACKFFLEFGSKDIDAEYQQEQSLRQTSILKNFTSGVAKAKRAVRSGSSDDLILDRALRVSGLDSNRVPSSNDNILSLSFAKIYFFLKELAPQQMPDGTVFDTFAKPLIEHLLSKAKTIIKPKKPTGGKSPNKTSLKQKVQKHSRELEAYQKALKESIPEIYNLIIEKLGGDVPEVISQRLKEIS